MSDKTHIEWTDATWQIITGCTLVSEGCRHCYAATLAATRLKHIPSRAGLARINAAGEAKFTGEVRFNEHWLDQPLRWKKPRRIFVCAHGDLFHESVPYEWIDKVFAVMALAPQHSFQVLTKRPERMRAYLTNDPYNHINIRRQIASRSPHVLKSHGDSGRMVPLPNVWLGTSVEDQAAWNARWPHLARTPAAVRFVSAEPLLGPLDMIGAGELHWLIGGGESGPHARPMHPEWARSLRDHCQALGVAYFFKQWGMWLPEDQPEADRWDWDEASERGLVHWWDDGLTALRLHKSNAGRLLDGREWNEMPKGGAQ